MKNILILIFLISIKLSSLNAQTPQPDECSSCSNTDWQPELEFNITDVCPYTVTYRVKTCPSGIQELKIIKIEPLDHNCVINHGLTGANIIFEVTATMIRENIMGFTLGTWKIFKPVCWAYESGEDLLNDNCNSDTCCEISLNVSEDECSKLVFSNINSYQKKTGKCKVVNPGYDNSDKECGPSCYGFIQYFYEEFNSSFK